MFTAGFVQFSPARYDVKRNLAVLESLLAGVHADLVVLPELANSGYVYGSPEELWPFAEDASGRGPFLAGMAALARSTGGLIVTGFAEAAGEGLYNSAAAVDSEGVRRIYRKTHLFADEKTLFLDGDSGFQVVPYRGVRVGMMICFDWFFPESARTLALAGAQIIAHPSNLVLPHCQQAMITRSLENVVFSVTANRYGSESLGDKTLTFTGASQLLDVKGRRLAQAPEAGDYVACLELDPALADNKAINPRNDLFADRRPDIYRC